MLKQLAVDVLAQVQPRPPHSHVAPSLEMSLLLALLGACLCFVLTRSRAAAALGGVAGWWLAVALSLTLLRGGYTWDPAGLRRCAITQPLVLSADGLTNLLLFAPTAFLCVVAIRRAAQVIVGIVLLSLLVEVMQAVSSVGVCDSSDVVLNSLGATVAALTALMVRSAIAGSRRTAVSGSDPCPRSS
jgi:hypothetical protein